MILFFKISAKLNIFSFTGFLAASFLIRYVDLLKNFIKVSENVFIFAIKTKISFLAA